MADRYKKPLNTLELRTDANRYLRAKDVLKMLRREYFDMRITAEEYKNLRKRALSGDVDGAYKEIGTILRRFY